MKDIINGLRDLVGGLAAVAGYHSMSGDGQQRWVAFMDDEITETRAVTIIRDILCEHTSDEAMPGDAVLLNTQCDDHEHWGPAQIDPSIEACIERNMPGYLDWWYRGKPAEDFIEFSLGDVPISVLNLLRGIGVDPSKADIRQGDDGSVTVLSGPMSLTPDSPLAAWRDEDLNEPREDPADDLSDLPPEYKDPTAVPTYLGQDGQRRTLDEIVPPDSQG